MARNQAATEKIVDMELMAKAIAKAVAQGNIVNFRFLFQPGSPAREESTEAFEDEKYAYLQPDEELEASELYRKAYEAVRGDGGTWAHIEAQLKKNGPAQLPSNLLLALADNAVRGQRLGNAAQAYELLRIRPRMQTMFLEEADKALDEGDIARAASGYRIAVGLAYNYAAFPEPLPAVPDYPARSLMLHAEYPQQPEDSVGLQDEPVLLNTALTYLLRDAELAARLAQREHAVQAAFIREIIGQMDPEWRAFTTRYREAEAMNAEFGGALTAEGAEESEAASALASEIEAQLGGDPRRISAHLLGRAIDEGEWWQYLKELAYEHPAAVLFVARQVVGESEILVPRRRGGSALARTLGLGD